MADDIVLRLRDSRYPGQFGMRHAAADEIERLRKQCATASVNQEDYSTIIHLADSMASAEHTTPYVALSARCHTLDLHR